jgi:hypothetical protein
VGALFMIAAIRSIFKTSLAAASKSSLPRCLRVIELNDSAVQTVLQHLDVF